MVACQGLLESNKKEYQNDSGNNQCVLEDVGCDEA